jgi:4-amino-4-deoxy-L-arabinose transferase-like glycosyltransferase
MQSYTGMPTLGFTSGSNVRGRVGAVVAAGLVFGIAVWLRSGALSGGSIDWDEADYAYAATRGFWTNWWDQSRELNGVLRHWHAPLSIYLIRLSTSLFGITEWAVRLPGVLASAVACGLVILAVRDLAGGSRRSAFAAGLAAGLLLATSPASIGMTQNATPHSLVELFLVLNLWCLTRYVREPTRAKAALFGLSLGGQFVSMEYGFIILGLSAIAVVLASPSRFRLPKRWSDFPGAHDVLSCLGACAAVVLALWPAGLLKAGVFHNLMYYVEYARQGHPTLFRGQHYQHPPKWAYLWWYWESFPVLLSAYLVALVLLGVWIYRSRASTSIVVGLFVAGLLASVHGSHIMGIDYSSFAIPPLLFGGVLAGGWLAGVKRVAAPKATAWRAVAAAAALAAGAVGVAGGTLSPGVGRGDTDAKELARRAVPLFEPGAVAIAFPQPILRYVAHLQYGRTDVQVLDFYPSDSRREALTMKRLEAGDVDWAYVREPVGRYDDSGVLRFLAAHFELVDREGDMRLFRRPRRPIMSAR